MKGKKEGQSLERDFYFIFEMIMLEETMEVTFLALLLQK